MAKVLTTDNLPPLFAAMKEYIDDRNDKIVNGCSVTLSGEGVTLNVSTVDYLKPATIEIIEEGTNKVQASSVHVLMGNEEITSTSYNHNTKTVTIAKVTDSINITAIGRPYDAEVEYLQSDGTPYIDTGLYGDKDLDYEIKAQRIGTGDRYDILGALEDASTNRYTFHHNNTSNTYAVYFYCGNSNYVRAAKSYRSTNPVVYKKTGLDIYIGANKIGTFASQTFSTPCSILLFGISNNGTFDSPFVGRVMYCKFLRNNTLVRDFVPVRNNGVGYLYDKVSGQLFGNAGSGAFTCGPDKV